MAPTFEYLCLVSKTAVFASSSAFSLSKIQKCASDQIHSVCSWASLRLAIRWRALREYLLFQGLFTVNGLEG